MNNYIATLMSQYAAGPITPIIAGYWNEWIRPDVNLDDFYDYCFNVETAQGFGLDILGRIVGIGRNITIPGVGDYFGFKEALPDANGFGQEPFYTRPPASSVYTLIDSYYRALILTKAAINISSATCQSINAILHILFAGRGVCYVVDSGNMAMEYYFDFALQPWELAIANDFLPRPSGVAVTVSSL